MGITQGSPWWCAEGNVSAFSRCSISRRWSPVADAASVRVSASTRSIPALSTTTNRKTAAFRFVNRCTALHPGTHDESCHDHGGRHDGVAARVSTRGRDTSWGTVLRGFVAVERTSSAPELARAKEELRKAGYRVSPGASDVTCDQGAREALGLTPGVDYFVEAVYFLTRQEAQQFVDAFQPGVVGTAVVTMYCRD